MDKPEEEIQRYQDYEMGGCFPLADGDYVKYEDHAKALSAERTKTNALQHSLDHEMEVKGDFVSKCKALESKLKEAHNTIGTMCDDKLELEAKVKERGEYISRMEDAIEELEKWKQGKKGIEDYYTVKEALATANAKIVELENDLSVIKELEKTLGQPYHLWAGTVLSQARTIATTNKKAEKLVEALEEICNARAAVQDNPNMLISSCHDAEATRDCVDMMKRYEASFELGEQAINEFRGEK